jgi:ribonuclease Z
LGLWQLRGEDRKLEEVRKLNDAELIVLGSAASVPDAEHDTVSLLLRGADWAVLIDCGGSPLHKLARLGVEPEEVRAVILTHRHADHIYGLPMLVQGLWLNRDGRKEPLPIYGPEQALGVARRLLELFNLAEREGMFEIQWHPIPLKEGRRVATVDGIEITSSPVIHSRSDTLALRFDNRSSGRAVVYSADTERCPALARLASGANLLIHEATGASKGHSTPMDAAEVAREAGVDQLALIHYPVRDWDLERWRSQTGEFSERALLARDGDRFKL